MVEEIASAWMSVARRGLRALPDLLPRGAFGTGERKALLPDMLGGEQLGAYCLSEPQAGSDVSAISTRATPRRTARRTA